MRASFLQSSKDLVSYPPWWDMDLSLHYLSPIRLVGPRQRIERE